MLSEHLHNQAVAPLSITPQAKADHATAGLGGVHPRFDRRGTRSMTILITADLHLDLWADAGRDPFAGIVPVLRDLDALIIAGDLADDPKRNWPWALERIARLVSPARIWVIPGNHDYYGATLDDSLLSRIATEAGVSLAQKRVLTFGSCRLLCCTLWTDFALTGNPEAAWRAPGWGCWTTPGSAGRRAGLSALRIPQRFTVIILTG